MIKKSDDSIICKNHFKNRDDQVLKTEFISKWIEMINKIEKNISIGLTDQ